MNRLFKLRHRKKFLENFRKFITQERYHKQNFNSNHENCHACSSAIIFSMILNFKSRQRGLIFIVLRINKETLRISKVVSPRESPKVSLLRVFRSNGSFAPVTQDEQYINAEFISNG